MTAGRIGWLREQQDTRRPLLPWTLRDRRATPVEMFSFQLIIRAKVCHEVPVA